VARIALRLLGKNEREVYQLEFAIPESRDDVKIYPGVWPRSNVRLRAKRVKGWKDRDARREAVLNHRPKCIPS